MIYKRHVAIIYKQGAKWRCTPNILHPAPMPQDPSHKTFPWLGHQPLIPLPLQYMVVLGRSSQQMKRADTTGL